MDIDLLKTFLVLSRTRHFGQAAEQLYLTQSAVSFRIKQLEEQLGKNLFIRHRNNIQLTLAGQQFIDYAEQLVTLWQQAKQVLQQGNHVELQLGATSAIWQGYLMPALVKQEGMPMVHSYAAPPALLREQLYQQQIDIVIQSVSHKREEWVNQSLADLLLQLFYLPASDQMIYWSIPWRGKPLELPKHLLIEQTIPVVDVDMACQLLAQRGGYVYLPIAYQQHLPQLQKVTGQTLVCPMHAIWYKNSEKADKIVQWLSQLTV